MKKFCRLLAMILSLLMLVSMFTACKQADEDDWELLGEDKETSFETDDPESESGSAVDPEDNEEGKGGAADPEKDEKDPEEKPDAPKEEAPAPDNFEEVVEQYDETKKYEVAHNPLLAEAKKPNTGVVPSFDIDTTGFVKNNVKLADLKGKTLTLLTPLTYGAWHYENEKGEVVDEFKWYEALKGQYGLNVKYIVSRYTESINQALTYMNAGKALDVIPTHIGGFPQFLNISQPLDPYINSQNLGNSPGVDLMTLEETKYAGGYRCISPIGCVDVLWYNQSQVEEFGLKDPHTLWEQDQWDWNAWRDFLVSIPANTSDGKQLAPMYVAVNRWWFYWPMTNGIHTIKIDTESKTPNLINNWMDERTIEAMVYATDVIKSLSGPTKHKDYMYQDGTCLMASSADLMEGDYDQYEYARTHKYNWVPFPKAPNANGRYVAFNIGYTMMLPKKMKTQSNAPYAVKFMELWATRLTEAMFDYLTIKDFTGWSYARKKQYFEFAIENTYFGLQMSEWRFLTGANFDAMRKEEVGLIFAITNKAVNYKTTHIKVENVVQKAVEESLAFAQ